MSGPGIALNLEQFKASFPFHFGFLHQHGVALDQLILNGRDHQPVPQLDVGALLAFLNPLSPTWRTGDVGRLEWPHFM